MSKILKACLFFIGAAIVTVYWFNSGNSSKSDTLPLATHCEYIQEGVLQWGAFVTVPASSGDAESAVREQIRYLDGLEHFSRDEAKRIILLHGLKIRIGTSKKNEDGTVTISYDAEKPAAFCNMSGKLPEKFALSLPFNPYSAFALVPVTQHRVLSFKGETLKTNPCADPEIVINSSPEKYWYTWQPEARGFDAFGDAYDCRSILKAGSDYLTTEARFVPSITKKVTNEFQPIMDSEILKMGVVFGFVSGQPDEKTLADAKRFFASHPNMESPISEERKTQDAAVWAVTDFFEQLKKTAEVSNFKVVDRGDYLRLSAIARLKNSNRAVSVEIFLGSTAAGTTVESDFLIEALENFQIVFYIGHSGAGSRIDWTALRPRMPAKQPVQILGVIGCYSTEYFDPLYADFRQSRDLRTILLLTDFSGYRYLLPLGLLSYLDNLKNSRPQGLAESLENYLEPGEKVLIRQF